MIDVLIPLVAGILLLTKSDIFMGKNMDEGDKEKKKSLLQKLGWVSIGISILYFISKVFIILGGR